MFFCMPFFAQWGIGGGCCYEVLMRQARFNVERERQAHLFGKSYKNDFCLFQFHSQVEIYFVDEGAMEMRVDGRQELLSAPAVSVALSCATHAYRTPEASRSSVLLIPAHLCEEFISATKGKRLESPFVTDPAMYGELKKLSEMILSSDGNRVKQMGYIYTLLGRLLDYIPLVESGSEMDADLASRILSYIEDNFKNGITPASVSSHFGYSQSYISRYFSSAFGTTLSRYLTSVRLRSAMRLMLEGKHDITYCALESGFSSMRTFYRSFHNEFGQSPTELIKEQNNQ